MPSAPSKPCAAPGCPRLITSGKRCEAHQKARYRAQDDRRVSPSLRGYDKAWYSFLAAYRRCVDLDADDPRFVEELIRRNRCAACWREGRENRQQLEYDHIVPLAQGGARLDPANVQPLCKRHHSAKTMSESVSANS